MRFTHPMEAARAIGLAVREIRVEMGEPSERTELDVAQIIKREYERWMTPVVEGTEPEAEGDLLPSEEASGNRGN